VDIAQSIKKCREEQGLTQKALANKMGVTPVLISQYENGKRNPKIKTLQKIADALEMSVSDLVGENNIHAVLLSEESSRLEQEFLSLGAVIAEAKTQEILNSNHVKLKNPFVNLLKNFEQLNNAGQQKAAEQVELLAKIPEYRKKGDAHDNSTTPEQKQHVEDIMDPNNWETD
jgi:transcriptional regulator with XRE-family HTH domain